MSFSLLLRTAQRSIVSSLFPAVRPLGGAHLTAGQKFHSVCDNRTAIAPSLLEATQLPLVSTVRGMKSKGRLQLRCKGCYFVYRQSRKYVMCKFLGRHKQQAIVKDEKNTWKLTHATQHKIRPW